MNPDTDDILFGEILTPDFLRGLDEFHTHKAFDDLCRRYGREQATKLWHEIPEEHDDDR
jgi:hypothetical protein